MKNTSLVVGAALLSLNSMAAWAQFKVVGPDGRVTYTDRAGAAPGKLTQTRPATGASVDASLPFALRGVAERFPVTLYTSAACGEACNVARDLLAKRGIPHRERTVDTDEDRVAWQQLGLASVLPVMRVGGQVHAGFNEVEWKGTLNLAGYPEQSALPRNYKAPAPSPLGERRAPAPAQANAEPVRTAPAPVDPAANPQGIRF
jgi:glutaredoxin